MNNILKFTQNKIAIINLSKDLINTRKYINGYVIGNIHIRKKYFDIFGNKQILVYKIYIYLYKYLLVLFLFFSVQLTNWFINFKNHALL